MLSFRAARAASGQRFARWMQPRGLRCLLTCSAWFLKTGGCPSSKHLPGQPSMFLSLAATARRK